VQNFVRDGDTKKFTAGSALGAGVGVLLGPSLVGIVTNDVANGAVGEAMLTGVFDVAKATGAAWTDGLKLYWDDTAKNFTTTSNTGANAFAGTADGAAGSSAAVGRINLNRSFP